MSVGESILVTVFNREHEVLMNLFRWLNASDLSDSEIILVDDQSTYDYGWLEAYKSLMPIKVFKMDGYPAFRTENGANGPSKAFNRALQEASGEKVCILSSDMIVPARVLAKARQDYDPNSIWCPMTMDLETSNEYCGPHRVFPMPWMLYTSREKVIEAGGWDENFLFGSCWDDNDFVGRLALVANKITCDWGSAAWHQSHYQPAYEKKQAIVDSNKRNLTYLTTKWAGSIPFGPPDMMAFEMARGRDESTGNFCLTFKDFKNVKERVLSMTLSPFIKVNV